MRLGLCCNFQGEDIRFRTTTAKALGRFDPQGRQQRLRAIAVDNAAALRAAIEFCHRSDIGCFRVNSQILPLWTHPAFGYDAGYLGQEIVSSYRAIGKVARQRRVRISFHPDQFVVLSSPHSHVVEASLAELEYQAEVAEWIGADVINIHGGGGYGDKPAALARFARSVARLSQRARERLTVENDDRIYRPSDLLPLCRSLELPFVYDVHHHRCHGDGRSVEATTQSAVATWNRQPMFHVSSPRDGWGSKNPRPHSDYIALADLPSAWEKLDCIVEVEAKAKEVAVLKLRRAIRRRVNGAQRREPSSAAA